MAETLGLDLTAIHGTGPKGRILKSDVEAAASGQAPARAPRPGESDETGAPPAATPGAPSSEQDSAASPKGEVTRVELNRTRTLIARRMADSKATVPDFPLVIEVDMERCILFRGDLKESGRTPVPSFNDFIVKATALALRSHPKANASWADGAIERYSRVNVGVAVAAPDTLVVPTVFDADRKSLLEIADEVRSLAEAVRDDSVTPNQLSAGTFTVSNLGMFGVKSFAAVVNLPQAGILAIGAMTRRMRPVGDEAQLRNVMELTLTSDHRVLYGADAAEFLAAVKGYLERPATLVA